MGSTTVDQAVRLVRQAVLQDSKRNYSEAARCYREAITSFRELRHSRASSKRLQELLDTKLGGFCLYPARARSAQARRACALRALGLLLSDSAA